MLEAQRGRQALLKERKVSNTGSAAVQDNQKSWPSWLWFSLGDLVLIVLAVGALMGFAILGYTKTQARNKRSETLAIISQIYIAADTYSAKWREYPAAPNSGKVELTFVNKINSALTTPPRKCVIKNNVVIDVWGNPLRIKLENHSLQVWSCGPNGVDENGAGDDVTLQPANSRL